MTIFDARVIGAGRAGGALAGALTAAGWSVDGPLGRDEDPSGAAEGTRIVLLAVPDGVVAGVAGQIRPGGAVIAHVAGSLGLDVLAPHRRVASVHPLVALPDSRRGAARLRGAWFATAGDHVAEELVAALDGRSVHVADADRSAYHAAAVIASNHLVALLGQAERVAAGVGVPLEAYLDLARGALDDVASVGTGRALTGPVSRGDWDTVSRHLEAIAPVERPAYSLLADAARRLRESAA